MLEKPDSTASMGAAGLSITPPPEVQPGAAPGLAGATVDAGELAAILGRCKKLIERAARHGELPRPFKLLGRNVWLRETIIQHWRERQQAEIVLAAKREKKRESF